MAVNCELFGCFMFKKQNIHFFLLNVLNNLSQKAIKNYLSFSHFFLLLNWPISYGSLLSSHVRLLFNFRCFRKLLGPVLYHQAGTEDIIIFILQGTELETREVKWLLKGPRIINSGGTMRTHFPATGTVFFSLHHITSLILAKATSY